MRTNATVNHPHHKLLLILGSVFLVLWIVLAIEPYNHKDWALENALVVLLVFILFTSYRYLALSRISYIFIFIFLCLHEIGAHYTYSEVPYDVWFDLLTGSTLNELVGWQRNNFDRIIHFVYGLLLVYPVREIFLRVADVRGFWGYFLPLNLSMSTSMMFELFEWGAAEIFGGDLGIAYLGTQGDIWDGQKDMALASLGALLAMILTALINAYLQRDFSREWNESLRVKHPAPSGDVKMSRLWKKRK